MTLRKLLLSGAMVAAISILPTAAVLAEDAAAPAPDADAAVSEEEEEAELTYQQQASALVDVVIEDYTVRMAALQAIIDMKDDEIAGNKDTLKKVNDTNKKLQTAVRTATSISKSLRAFFTALPDTDASKADSLAALDRLDTAITKSQDQ